MSTTSNVVNKSADDSNSSSKRNFRRIQGRQSDASKSKTKKQQDASWSRDPKKSQNGNNADDEDGDSDVCLICAETLNHVALTPCNHKTCNKCSFRQLVLYDKKNCLICRTEIKEVIFTENSVAVESNENYIKVFAKCKSSFVKDLNFSYINFTSKTVMDDTLDLLKFYCEVCNNNEEDFGSFKKLHEHLRSEHNKALCMICATHKHAFPSELTIFTPNQLKSHQSKGNDAEGFKGHPMCAFCSGRRFYSDDELYLHMREKHEKCHICDKIDHNNPQYFRDYDQLFEHFKHFHYACTVPSCLEMKFVVFRDELELQAHILQEHGNIIKGKPKFFQSELSTFISTPSRVIQESDNAGNLQSLNSLSSLHTSGSATSLHNREESTESPAIRKLRLEERAKYYLDNSNEDFEKFQTLNEQYNKSRLSVSGLLDAYRNIFTTPQSDIYLLIRNLSETYPRGSKKFDELNKIYMANEQLMERQNTNNSLPTLTNDRSYSVPVVSGTWGNAGAVQSSAINSLRNLPSLPTPTSSDPFSNPYKTKSFKTIKKSSTNAVNTFIRPSSNNSVNFTSSFDQAKKTSSTTSLSSQLSGSGIKNKLSDLDLPSLPTPKPRRNPPVNPPKIPDPKRWGRNDGAQVNEELLNDTLLSLNDLNVKLGNSKGKKKSQQKQLLFHIGI